MKVSQFRKTLDVYAKIKQRDGVESAAQLLNALARALKPADRMTISSMASKVEKHRSFRVPVDK